MSEEKSMGVFSSFNNGNEDNSYESKIFDLERFQPDDKSDTIYNLLFREFDEEMKS